MRSSDCTSDNTACVKMRAVVRKRTHRSTLELTPKPVQEHASIAGMLFVHIVCLTQ
jgi:hypothetical protein